MCWNLKQKKQQPKFPPQKTKHDANMLPETHQYQTKSMLKETQIFGVDAGMVSTSNMHQNDPKMIPQSTKNGFQGAA